MNPVLMEMMVKAKQDDNRREYERLSRNDYSLNQPGQPATMQPLFLGYVFLFAILVTVALWLV